MSLIKVKKESDLFPSLLSDFFDSDKLFKGKWMDRTFEVTLPAVNIKETKNAYKVEFAAPGFTKTDFKVNLEGHLLNVSAEKEDEKLEENDRFTRKEFSYNSFNRSFNLPEDVDGEQIDAKYTDGILRLRILKKETAKSQAKKEIQVG